jgi:mono/diheme cytochrome c family protein
MTVRPACFALCLAACDVNRPWPAPEPGLERMIEQGRADAYEPSRWFADGKVMRPLPPGAVPYQRREPSPDIVRAVGGIPTRTVDRPYETTIPIAVDRELVELGAARFRVFCGVCHGPGGDGRSPVATAMTVRKPPSLLEERLIAYPAGRIFAVISEGYGLMPSYGLQLEERARWAVVAHVQRLQGRPPVTTSRLGGDGP